MVEAVKEKTIEKENLDDLVQKYWAQLEKAEEKKQQILERLLAGESSQLVELRKAKPILDEKALTLVFDQAGLSIPIIKEVHEDVDVAKLKAFWLTTNKDLPILQCITQTIDEKKVKTLAKANDLIIPTKVNPDGKKPYFAKRSEQ